MHLRLEPNCGVPLGTQIVRQLRLAIVSKRLLPGERLPSARDLAGTLGVNFHTVRKAYGDLERAGLARFERGKGTYVVEDAPALARGELRALVREHLGRLAADLAGAEVDREEVEELVLAELEKLLGDREARR